MFPAWVSYGFDFDCKAFLLSSSAQHLQTEPQGNVFSRPRGLQAGRWRVVLLFAFGGCLPINAEPIPPPKQAYHNCPIHTPVKKNDPLRTQARSGPFFVLFLLLVRWFLFFDLLVVGWEWLFISGG